MIAAVLLMAVTSCVKDLDVEPLDDDVVTSASVYDNPESYRQVLAKLYAVLAMSGQQGPAGDPDISGIDEGFSNYLRQYWVAQEISTDEAVVAWSDPGLPAYNYQTWGASNDFATAMYNRIFYMISVANEYLRETTDAKLSDRGVSGDLRTEVEYYRAEARFLRALAYWHALDMYGSVPFVTEDDAVGAFFPEQASRSDLFNYVETELLEIENLLVTAGANEYARADQAAAWMVLAKLYLNAEVYIGQAKYTECITYVNKVINAGYSLESDYQHLFLADNHNSSEIIFPVAFDGNHTKTWGGMTFVIHAGVGGDMDPAAFGIDGGWGGNRTTSALVNKFDDITGETDSRAMFFTEGQELEIEDVAQFKQGYAITKFRNVDSQGNTGSDLTHPDTDFPMFRLADAYLMYAEAVLRGGSGGDMATAVNYVNMLRERAYGDQSGNITQSELTLDFIIDERARELFWEGHRRTDLIRFGHFSGGDYLWPWKGNVQEGTATPSTVDLFPIPASDIGANPNLTQNPGY